MIQFRASRPPAKTHAETLCAATTAFKSRPSSMSCARKRPAARDDCLDRTASRSPRRWPERNRTSGYWRASTPREERASTAARIAGRRSAGTNQRASLTGTPRLKSTSRDRDTSRGFSTKHATTPPSTRCTARLRSLALTATPDAQRPYQAAEPTERACASTAPALTGGNATRRPARHPALRAGGDPPPGTLGGLRRPSGPHGAPNPLLECEDMRGFCAAAGRCVRSVRPRGLTRPPA